MAVRPRPVISAAPSRRLIRALQSRGYTHSHQFMLLPSQSKPRWLLPVGNSNGMLAGSQIYMPHKPLARLAKAALVAMIKTGWDGWGCQRVLVASRESLAIEELVRDVAGETKPLFAMSLGTRPAVSKLTVQVMSQDGQIVGYVKLPLTEVATRRVRHEAAVLERLWSFPNLRAHVPRLLYSGVWNDTYLLFQSPLDGQLSPLTLSDIHENFLQALQNVHSVSKPGPRLVEEVAPKWTKAAPRLGSQWQALGDEALRRVARSLNGSPLRCSLAHGDFAPWNMRIRQEDLLLFDWESADWEAPHGWDSFHFHVQTASSFNGKDPEAVLPRAPGEEMASCILYLLTTACQFLEEENQQAVEYRRKLLTSLLLSSN